MGRYFQTLSRIGSGLVAYAMFTWFLWPGKAWEFEPEPFFAFIVALGFWIGTEYKKSEEVIFRESTKNDIRLGREILCYTSEKFRTLLKDHDYHRGISPRYLTEASFFLSEVELGIAGFQDKQVQVKFTSFTKKLSEFESFLGMHSSPELYGSNLLQAIIPYRIFDELNISDRHQGEINEANRLATESWMTAVQLVAEIKVRIPEVFDDPIKRGWVRTTDDMDR